MTVQNAMFAAALAYNMDIGLEDIRHGLRTFDSSFFQAPGRTNIYDEHPFRVILDYAHNPAAVTAMCGLVDRFDVEGRKIVVLSAPGDRRDEDIREIAEIAAGHFDHFICRCDDNRRGRGEDEVAVMLKNKLLEEGISADKIEVVPDEQEATRHALESRTGDGRVRRSDSGAWGQHDTHLETDHLFQLRRTRRRLGQENDLNDGFAGYRNFQD